MEELSYLLDFYKKRVERNPQLLSSHAIYSEYLILSERIDESILISLKSLLVSPWFLRSQIDLGLSYLLKGDYKSSESELKHALKIDPESDYAYLLLGILYYVLGIYDISIEYLKEGFNYNPKNYYIRNLYYILTKNELPLISHFKETENKVLNGFINSEEMMKIRLENSGKKPYELLYALSLKNENKLIEAIETIERILIYNPYYPNALYTLGKFYEMSGNRRKKDECWEKCVDVNPMMDKIGNLAKNYENIHFDFNDLKELQNLNDKIVNNIFIKLVQEEVTYEKIPEEKVEEVKVEEKEIEKVEEKEEEVPFKLEEIEEIPVKTNEIEEQKEILPKLEEYKEEKIPFIEEKSKIESEEIIKTENVEKSSYYKKLGDDFLKKGMYKEAIEMFTKALKLSKEKS
ncbi:MAG: tetratricopeptide repeat protein [Caldisericia bacterium]